MKQKPFRSIDEQIEILESRGVSTDSETPKILLREGYYSVVNGYKDPFIDAAASKAARDDRYIEGTTFDDLYRLFKFDRSLREITFHHLLTIEALFETICTYTFSEMHPDPEGYLLKENYATKSEYRELGLAKHEENIRKLFSDFYNAIGNPKNGAVEHYRGSYGYVPLWVLIKTMTFGNVEHFFNLMKREDQNLICKRIIEVTGDRLPKKKQLAPIRAKRAIDIIVKYRNKCAHDERLYCATVDKRNPVDYFGCVRYCSDFMPLRDYCEFIKQIIELVQRYSEGGGAMSYVLEKSGFTEFSLTELPRFDALIARQK